MAINRITAQSLSDGTITAAKVAADMATQAELDTKLNLSGGALTGAVTTNSTFDGVDIATRDAVLTSTTTTAGAALPKAGGTMTGAIDFGDNVKANFGNNDDLQIYGNNNASFIHETGSGHLYVRGSMIILKSQADNDDYMKCYENGSVNLFYSNAEKFATTSTGIDVTGSVTTDGLISPKLTNGNGGLRIHSSGTKFFAITEANAVNDGAMDIGASDARFKDLYLSGTVKAGAFVPSTLTSDQINWEDPTTSQSLSSGGSGSYSVIGSVSFTIPTITGITNWMVDADSSWTGAHGGNRLWTGLSLDSTSTNRNNSSTVSSGYTESGWYEGDLSVASFAVMQNGSWEGVSSGSHTVRILAWTNTTGYTCWRRGINVRWKPQV